MNKFELITRISAETGVKQKVVETVIDEAIEQCSSVLSVGGSVTIMNFGRFDTIIRGPSRRVSNLTGTSRVIELPRRVMVKFITSNTLLRRAKKMLINSTPTKLDPASYVNKLTD